MIARRDLAVIIGFALGAIASVAAIRSGTRRRADTALAARPDAAPTLAPGAAPAEDGTPPAGVAQVEAQPPRGPVSRRINWPFVVSFVVSVVTLCVVAFQTFLMVRQTDILDKQDKLLAHRAQLTVRADKLKVEGDLVSYSIVAQNVGPKGASGYHWTMLVPAVGGPFKGFDRTNAESGEPVTIDGATFTPYKGYIALPLFPGLRQEILKIHVRRSDPGEKIEIRFFWRIAAEDGVFPEGAIRPDGSVGKPGLLIVDGR